MGHFDEVPHSLMHSALTQSALTIAHSQVVQLEMNAGYLTISLILDIYIYYSLLKDNAIKDNDYSRYSRGVE